jgi:MFS family permease
MAATNETTRPASLAAVTTWVAPAERRMAFALTRLAINLGVSVGPALGGFLVTRSFRFLFWIDGGSSLAAGTVLLVMAYRLGLTGLPHSRPAVEVEPGAGPASTAPIAPRAAAGGSPYADRRFLSFLAINTLVTLIFFQHNSTMPLYLVETLGLSPAVYGLLFTLNTLIIVAVEVPLNGMMAHWPYRRSLALGAVLTGLGFGGLALVSSTWGAAATVVVWTFGEMITFPTAAAYASDFAPADRQGAYMGAYSMSAAAAFALGPWAGTRILEAWGGRAVWSIMILCGAVAGLLYWRMQPIPPPGTGVLERAEA